VNPRLIHRFVGLGALGALALVLPTLALGGVRPDDRSGPLGAVPASVGYSASDDVFMRAVARHNASTSTSVRPDDRSGALGAVPISAGSLTTGLRPDDRSGPLGAQPTTIASRTTSVSISAATTTGEGFQWLDAAIGAASVLAMGLILLATVALQRQHRRGAVAH
jgi:hypothetical protein